MKKFIAFTGGIALFFLVAGAGCADQSAPEAENIFESKPAANESGITMTDSEGQPVEGIEVEINNQDGEQASGDNRPLSVSEVTEDEFALKAELMDEGSVKLMWQTPEELKGENIRIYRGPTPTPAPPLNFWVNPGMNATEYIWADLEPRPEYFRLCVFEDDECQIFSESVQIEVR